MATTKRKRSSLKRIRQNARRAAQGRPARSAIRTLAKAARASAGSTSDEMRNAQSALDRAAARGKIHRNAAARRTSRLMKALAKKA